MKALQRGLTLVELIAAVAIIGIFTAIAVPAYHDYSMRGRVSELLLATVSTKAALADGMRANGSWAAWWMSSISISANGLVTGARIDTNTGTIIISGNALTSGAVVTLTPHTTTGRALVWTCGGTPERYMPAGCR